MGDKVTAHFVERAKAESMTLDDEEHPEFAAMHNQRLDCNVTLASLAPVDFLGKLVRTALGKLRRTELGQFGQQSLPVQLVRNQSIQVALAQRDQSFAIQSVLRWKCSVLLERRAQPGDGLA
jgi:hypothetical protein